MGFIYREACLPAKYTCVLPPMSPVLPLTLCPPLLLLPLRRGKDLLIFLFSNKNIMRVHFLVHALPGVNPSWPCSLKADWSFSPHHVARSVRTRGSLLGSAFVRYTQRDKEGQRPHLNLQTSNPVYPKESCTTYCSPRWFLMLQRKFYTHFYLLKYWIYIGHH